MDDTKPPHDAEKTLSEFRDHIARHDKPIAFFFGAGTSSAITMSDPGGGDHLIPFIPSVEGLTRTCRDRIAGLGEKYKNAWADIDDHCRKIGQKPNIENILSRLRIMLNAIGESDTLFGLQEFEIRSLEELVRKTIAEVVTPNLDHLPNDYPHRKFARWLVKTSRKAPVEIFTVNYDVLIEHALESEYIPIFDGFVGGYRPFFHPDSLRRSESGPGVNWTRLWKMHGSVTWRRVKQDGRERVVRGEPDQDGDMIYPSFLKYDESRQQPYAAFIDRLTRFLNQDDALLIVAGFSFGDQHLNNLVFGALENRPRSHVYALQFDEVPEGSDLIKRAYQHPNMIVIGPITGVIFNWTNS